MKRFYFFLAIAVICTQFIVAQSIRQDIKSNPLLSAGTYLAYPDRNNETYTPAPDGYVPFHIEHYGRHGSRWLTSKKQYLQPIEALQKAEKYGFLTEKGKDALNRLSIIYNKATNRFGELSALGAEQHRGIARRMYRNFPEVFADSATIDARSTVVIRCILSMENECQELIALNPQLKVFHDASQADMYYMNYYDDSIKVTHNQARALYKEITANSIDSHLFMNRLISNNDFITDSIDATATMEHIFDVASNMQSHNFDFDLYDIFSDDEIYALWERWNKFWYLGYGNSPQLEGKCPFIQSNLLNNIIECADRAISSGEHGANLRFGHEVCVLPLAVLMELNDCNRQVDNLDNLANEWRAHEIFPMACNIQMIFYRSEQNNDILVKVLLNERETTLPIAPAKTKTDTKSPLYSWQALRSYYLKKLNR